MTVPYVDTDVIIRLLTGDDPAKQAAAAALFAQVETGTLPLATTDVAIGDAVYVLASPRLYHLPRTQIAALLTPLVRLTHFHVQNRRAVLTALQLYATTSGLDFGDALLVGVTQGSGGAVLYSYDRDFDRVPGITRREP